MPDDATTTAVGVVARGIALAPLIATTVALTTPAVLQDLSSAESQRRLTVLGTAGQFDGLESATGVVPLTILLIVTLLAQLAGAIALLVDRASETKAGTRWLPVALTATGGVTVAVTLLLVPVLSSADDVDNPQPAIDHPYGLTASGWALLTLAGVVAIAAGSLTRSAREWLE